MKWKTLVVFVILAIVTFPSTNAQFQKISNIQINSANSELNRTIWYVGGDGPSNYTRIQDAIDNASNGDTIFVYTGTYKEELVFDKSIYLIGENNSNTIIISYSKIYAEDVYIKNFTIKHGIEIIDTRNVYIYNNKFSGWSIPLIDIDSSYNCTIRENILQTNEYLIDGIWIYGSNITVIGNKILNNGAAIKIRNGQHTICDNIISDNIAGGIIATGSIHHSNISNNFIQRCGANGCGIEFRKAGNTQICNNIINNTACGISLHTDSKNNLIFGNIIHENKIGIKLIGCDFTNISGNSFENNKDKGVYVRDSLNTSVSKNNFIGNNVNAYFRISDWNVNGWIKELQKIIKLMKIVVKNYNFDSNSWGKISFFPVRIHGEIVIWKHWYDNTYRWRVFDWHPAKEPYDI